MRGLEDNVIHEEGRFRGPNADSELEIRRKQQSGFSFAIGMRPQVENQTHDNITDIRDYQTGYEGAHRQVGQGALEAVQIPIAHPTIETEDPLARTLAPTKRDLSRLALSFPREADLLSRHLLERAKMGDTSDQIMAQLAMYTFGMMQSQQFHTRQPSHPRPELRLVPDTPDAV